eukprot:232012_1
MATKFFTLISTLIYLATSCDKNIQFTTDFSSRVWWLTFRVTELCCGSVTKVEVKDALYYPTFVTGIISDDPTQEEYWIFDNAVYQGNYFTGPITVRLTNSYNETLTFTDILPTVNPGMAYYSDTNFQHC